jgi:D-lactate dehydrogenase
MIDKKSINKMKDGVIIINTSRGGLIDTESLIDGLKSKKVLGAGLDVIEGEELIKEEKELLHSEKNKEKLEQLIEDHILISMNNVVFTPHIAFYSEEALQRIIDETIDSIKKFVKDEQLNEKKVV